MSTTNDGPCHHQTAGFGHQPITPPPAVHTPTTADESSSDPTVEEILANMSDAERRLCELSVELLARFVMRALALAALETLFSLMLESVESSTPKSNSP